MIKNKWVHFIIKCIDAVKMFYDMDKLPLAMCYYLSTSF